ncbi:antibiotic biosynthesis monooxygenase family protein [Nocardia sp. NPDC051900]|uniref:antibiotic biosynthesis monooxygenase family protein n=1 Tax=Nocardia sp. NPDC051900 TaxID=3364326 RepID=UPI0037A1E324
MTHDGMTVIDTIRLPLDGANEYIAQWRERAGKVSRAPGFRSAHMHRATSADAPLPLVMVAEWDSVAARDAALRDSAFRASARAAGAKAEVVGSEYRVAAEYRSAVYSDGPGITFVNVFELPAEHFEEFLAHWRTRAELMSAAPGFRDNRLHRALDPAARYTAVNVAHWDSAAAWRSATENPAFQRRLAAAPGFATAHPQLYEVVAGFPAEDR